MTFKPLSLAASLAAAALLSLPALQAQTVVPASATPPPAHPLDAIPYSPSLDLTSMDKTVDPCVDFYKYTCGGWQKNNPIPSDQASWSVYAKLGTENQQFLWGILEEDAAARNRTPVQQKVGDYFASCMNTAAIDAGGTGEVAARKGVFFATPFETPGQLAQNIASLQREFAGSFFFNSGVGQDALHPETEIAQIGAGGLGLPDRDYYLKEDARSVTIRAQYVAYIVQLFKLAGHSQTQSEADAKAVMTIETALAKASLTRVERRDPNKTYHMMTVQQLDKLAPIIDWQSYFETQGGTGVMSANVSQPEFIKAVQAELSSEPLEALTSYVQFHALTGLAPYLTGPYRQANFDFFSHTLRGTPVMPPRWKTCTQAVDRNLGEALGQEFVRRTFTADMKARTQLMTEQVETAMQAEIAGLAWMSPATKVEAQRKLHAIRNKIGYPDHWRDYTALEVKPDDYAGNAARSRDFENAREWAKLNKPVDLNEWGMTPPTVNAYFNPQMNDINFPAGVLQPPLYDAKEDDAPNYGNTGATIGHELTHAFDDEGRKFDSTGALRDWWTAADAKGFEDRINCVRDQYAGYVVVDDIHINSKLTSGEDVADLGGTLLAYIAWQKQTAGQRLTAREGFTPDQRFFIGMGQWACENERPANQRLQAATDPHSPGFARINGIVSNMPQFQAAFKCKTGQAMVHTPTCRVW